ncbi:MAG: hypothetical protein KF830_08435 [Planctomycetes bacterium]|nr:hypothetical protein [Planctomycetota bacterium]
MPDATGSSQGLAPRQRVLTLPLALLLLTAFGLLAQALHRRLAQPDAATAIALLADGDLDGAERRQVMQRLVAVGSRSERIGERWAAALAAVALGDRAAWAAAAKELGGGEVPQALPPATERDLLPLGEPMLRNLAAAWLAEASGAPQEALVHWRRLATQCRFVPHPLAAELAAEGIRRTSRGP